MSYGKLCTMVYDLDKPFAKEEEIKIYTDCIKDKNDKILEPMCGSGRFYIPLLEAGYNITGFDLSDPMLESCRKRCEDRKLTPDIFKADITEFHTKEKYKYVIIPIGSLSLLIRDDQVNKSFKKIYSCLVDKGTFIFSFLNSDHKFEDIENWEESKRFEMDKQIIVCKQRSKYEKNKGIYQVELKYELIDNGKIIEDEYQDFPMRLFKEADIILLLKDIGFKNIMTIQNDYFSILSCHK